MRTWLYRLDGFLDDVRYWLIRRVAGKDATVAINVHVVGSLIFRSEPPPIIRNVFVESQEEYDRRKE